MIVTVAGSPVEPSRIDVRTLAQTAWAWLAAPSSVAAAVGDPVEITTRDGALVLTGEVAKVERSHRHQRIVVRPVVLADMDRRMVDPTTLHDQTVPDLLAAVLGDHAVRVRPPLDTVQVPLWSTRERSQRWCLEAVLRTLNHAASASVWRYSARDDSVHVFAPGDTAERQEHAVNDPLLARGGAVEVSAVRYAVEAGDLLNGRLIQRVDTVWMKRVKRSLAWA